MSTYFDKTQIEIRGQCEKAESERLENDRKRSRLSKDRKAIPPANNREKFHLRKFGKAVFLEPVNEEFGSKMPEGSKRGEIKGFSLQSNQRFCEVLVQIDHAANVEAFGGASWITLTFDGNETGAEKAKCHLDYILSKVMPRAGFDGPKIWKAELQKRGTIHFHILAFDPTCDGLKQLIAEQWHKRTGSKQAAHLEHGTDVAEVPDVKRLRCYLAKYLSKETGADAKQWGLGRVWGIYGRAKLIKHEEQWVDMEICGLKKLMESAKREGVQVPRRIYDVEEWIQYAEEMFNRKRVDRVSYFSWRKTQKIERAKKHKADKMNTDEKQCSNDSVGGNSDCRDSHSGDCAELLPENKDQETIRSGHDRQESDRKAGGFPRGRGDSG